MQATFKTVFKEAIPQASAPMAHAVRAKVKSEHLQATKRLSPKSSPNKVVGKTTQILVAGIAQCKSGCLSCQAPCQNCLVNE